MPDLYKSKRIGPLVDGMRQVLSRLLIAHTRLIQDATAKSSFLMVDNSIRFKAGEQIVIFDDNSVWDDDIGKREGVEFHTVKAEPSKTNKLILNEPLKRSFLISSNARVQKAIEFSILDEKDIHYGDREGLAINEVAICVEPETKSSEWLALGAMAGYEYRLGIMVYAKVAGSGENRDEDRAARVCHAYADAIEDYLIRNIHVDLTIDEVPLLADVCPGESWVYIPKSVAHLWPPDGCARYEVQDNFHAQQEISLINCGDQETSSTDSTCQCYEISSTSGSLVSSSSSDSEVIMPFSSSSKISSDFSTSSSRSSMSQSNSSSSSWLSQSTMSSKSSLGGEAHFVCLSCPIPYHLRVSDKAVLRRKERYMYDSRVESVEYGNVAKGSFILKAAKLSWFGKESRIIPFPQIGLGGNAY